MTIIEKTFSAFREAYLANKPQSGVSRFFLVREGNSTMLIGALLAADNNLYVISSQGSYIQVLETDIIELRDP